MILLYNDSEERGSIMKAKPSDWYKHNWGLEIKNMSWVENTVNEVDHIIKLCGLQGGERILDLACGYGRHSLEFAKRGYDVVGIDITKIYIEDAVAAARANGLDNADFICCDIRDVSFSAEFDVVLNLADGAIGYLENDEENLKIFDIIARSLKCGGHHVCDIVSGEYADAHFPARLWDAGVNTLSLSEFDWDKDKRIMLFGNCDIPYGEQMKHPEIPAGDPTRLYTLPEIKNIMQARDMKVVGSYAGYTDIPAGKDHFQMLIHSIKTE